MTYNPIRETDPFIQPKAQETQLGPLTHMMATLCGPESGFAGMTQG